MSKDNTKKVSTQEVTPRQIKDGESVTCIKQGDNFAEVVSMAYTPRPGAIALSKEEYVVIRTGEILPYDRSEDGKQKGNLAVTFRELRWLIRTNFAADSKNQLFVTLTYDDNMTDAGQLYSDFKNFMDRLRYRMPEHTFEYIVVMEPQGRGAWHSHLMLKSDKPSLYIDHAVMSQIWGDINILRQTLINSGAPKSAVKKLSFAGLLEAVKAKGLALPEGYRPIEGHGWTTTERLKSDDVGAYYVAYFTDLTQEGTPDKPESAENMSKARKKGSRLAMYPKGFRFYRCSRGILRPEKVDMRYGDVRKQYGQATYKMAYSIDKTEILEDGTEDVQCLNRVQRETFKRKPKRGGK